MAADRQEGALKPIAPARVAEELKKLSRQRGEGQLDADEYEHRFARMISELRDRRIDGSRAEILDELGGRIRTGIGATGGGKRYGTRKGEQRGAGN